jgi:hypothetical protein
MDWVSSRWSPWNLRTVAVVFVIFIAPVALCAPAMLVFIPPPVIGTPAMLAGFTQVMACAFGLLTPIAMVLDGLMQPVVDFCDSTMALFITISTQIWSRAEHGKSKRYCGGERLSSEKMWQSL